MYRKVGLDGLGSMLEKHPQGVYYLQLNRKVGLLHTDQVGVIIYR